jgi:hypothetical protein
MINQKLCRPSWRSAVDKTPQVDELFLAALVGVLGGVL